MTAAEYFVRGLRERGCEWVATLCGHGLDPLFQAAKNAGLRLVDARNEQTAAYMAEAWGRLTRRPGVCAVSSGVAHANALTGVVNAWFDGAPMLLISGAAAHATAGLGHFQDLDQVALAAPVTAYSRAIDAAPRTLEILDRAWRAAARGPAHLTFPMDVQTAPVEPAQMIRPVPAASSGAGALEGGGGDSAAAARALARSERPLIVAGSGAYYSCQGEALIAFSERARIPFVIPIWDRGIASRPAETYMGVIGAASGGPRLLADADCILLAGAAADYRLGYLQPGAIREDARIVRVEGGWKQLAGEHRGSHAPWLAEAQKRRAAFQASIAEKGASQAGRPPGLHAIHIVAALADLPEDAVLVIDGGSIGQWAHQLLAGRYPSHWLTCGRSGVVGYGIAGAMAARLAFPQRPVVLLSGDGAFTFTVAELECAVRQKLPFAAIVADDLGWGITRAGHLRQFGEAISSSLGPIAFDRLAESLGARGRRAETPEQVRSELAAALDRPEVTVIHAPVVGGNP